MTPILSESTRQLEGRVTEIRRRLYQKAVHLSEMILKHISDPKRVFEDPQMHTFLDDLKNLRKMTLEERPAR